MTTRLATTLLLASSLVAGSALADTVVISPTKDNTLYESAGGENSNARGVTMFSGKTFQGFEDVRRAVFAFDVAGNVPAGSTITGAELTLYMSKLATGSPPTTMDLHRLTADWGEGTSMADSTGGFGTFSTPGDATWIHRFYNTIFWTTPGGDFDAASSASIVVGGVGFYVWGSTPGMVSDVQGWVTNPASNAGWILIGDELTPGSARRFNTREHVNVGSRPKLTVHYNPPFVPVMETTWGRIKATYTIGG